MYPRISFLDPPNALTNKVPTIGENNTGVRKETPNNPYFLQKTTNFLFLFENIFLSLLNILFSQFLNRGPKKDIMSTVVIIPNIVVITVSRNDNPTAAPTVGPPTNFSILTRYTVKYLPIPDNIESTIQLYMCNIYKSLTTGFHRYGQAACAKASSEVLLK